MSFTVHELVEIGCLPNTSNTENSGGHLSFDPTPLSRFIKFSTEEPVCYETYRTSKSGTPLQFSRPDHPESTAFNLKITASQYHATSLLSGKDEAVELTTSSTKCDCSDKTG